MPSALWKCGVSPHPTLPEQGAVLTSEIVNLDKTAFDFPPAQSITNNDENIKDSNEIVQVEIENVVTTNKATRKSKKSIT